MSLDADHWVTTVSSPNAPSPLSAEVCHAAYRLHTPCLCRHTTPQNRFVNCVGSPRCLAGIQQLSTDPGVLLECASEIMGPAPVLLPETAAVSTSATVASTIVNSSSSYSEPNATNKVISLSVTPAFGRGIRNLGNTCYLSAVLQLLFSVPGVRQEVLNACDDSPPPSSASPPLSPPPLDGSKCQVMGNHIVEIIHSQVSNALSTSCLGELLAEMSFSRDGAGANPKPFATFLSLDPSIQQDAQECFALLLGWLQREGGAAVHAAVRCAFEGALLYDRQCTTCGRSFKRAEPFFFLSVPVRSSVEDAVNAFLLPEEVQGFVCEGCGATTTATSMQYIRTIPEVLVVHLNRFTFDLQTLQREKVTSPVSFPLDWNLTDLLNGWKRREVATCAGAKNPPTAHTTETTLNATAETHYELCGVVNHLGDTALSGHYTYYGKTAGRSGWYHFDDAEVSKLQRFQGARGSSKDAYMLVYQRRPNVEESLYVDPAQLGENNEMVPVATASLQIPSIQLPPRLVQHVQRVNNELEQALFLWNCQRSELVSFLDHWGEAARDLFGRSPMGSKTVEAATPDRDEDVGDWFAVPTSWLRQMGRGFLPSNIDLGHFSTGDRRKKRGRGDATTASRLSGTKENNREKNTGEKDVIMINDEESTSRGADAQVKGAGQVGAAAKNEKNPFMEARSGKIGRLVSESVARASALAEHRAWIACPHGRVAPTAPYKLLPPSIAEKLAPLLSLQSQQQQQQQKQKQHSARVSCLPQVKKMDCVDCDDSNSVANSNSNSIMLIHNDNTNNNDDCEDDGDDMEGTKGGSPLEGCRVRAMMCDACATSLAEEVLRLKQCAQEEEKALAMLREGSNDLNGIYVSGEILDYWENVRISRSSWRDVVIRQGFTALYAVQQQIDQQCWRRLQCGNKKDATQTTTGKVHQKVVQHLSEEDYEKVGDDEEGDPLGVVMPPLLKDVTLLCEHGLLAPLTTARVVPEALWQYLRDRIISPACSVGNERSSSRGSRDCSNNGSPTSKDSNRGPMTMLDRLLPRVLAFETHKCPECIRNDVANTAERHHARMLRMDAAKRFPIIASASQLLTASAADVQMHHPNRAVWRRALDRPLREHRRAWEKCQSHHIAALEARVANLAKADAADREAQARWNALRQHQQRRRSRRPNNPETGSPNKKELSAGSPCAEEEEEEEHPAAVALREAQEALSEARAAPCPDRRAVFGCVPTWWVAEWRRWYTGNVTDSEASTSSPPRSFDFNAFRCPHGGTLFAPHLLNPVDPFWESRARAAHFTTLWQPREGEEGESIVLHPPLLIVPMEEFMELASLYGRADLLATSAAERDAKGEERKVEAEGEGGRISAPQTAGTQQIDTSKVVLFVERNMERVLEPSTCDACAAKVLENVEMVSRQFVNGTLRLQLHLRRSKRQFYDSNDILTGVHYTMTLRELQLAISQRVIESHGFILPLEDMELLRGRKVLRTERERATTAVATSTVKGKVNSVVHIDAEGMSDRAEECTLFDCGLCDGDVLTVNATERVLIATGVVDTKEEWESIPPELLCPQTQENPNAFGATRLCGAPDTTRRGGNKKTQVTQVACDVCTFLNEPSLSRCEMCETPLRPSLS